MVNLTNICILDTFKIDLFKNEYGINFPDFKHLSKEESLVLADRILRKFKLSSIDTLVDLLYSQNVVVLDIDANDGLNLIDTLVANKLELMKEVYINWFQFDNVDIIKLEDLNKYFLDIWYTSSDDIDIFDESLEWILSIRHDGSISILNCNFLALSNKLCKR